jgi:prepilin-type N-terminal cleavage/methylation domain-containing protein
MKKAFTMLELIFVLVIIGIIARVILPRLQRDPIHEAGVQLLSHIRYTQHLAMVDDKYDADDSNWYKNRWQIMFEKSAETNNQYSYTVFSDWKGKSTGNASFDEIATNPQDKSKKLTGGTNGVVFTNPAVTPSMNIGRTYSITDVKVTGGGGKTTTAKRVFFDNLGRIYKKNTNSLGSVTDGLANKPIYIKICQEVCEGANNISTNDQELVIRIENETGYACILQKNTNDGCLQ